MPAEAASENPLQTRILSLQMITLVWMVLECSVALFAAWRARSVSLLAFGSDSFVELLSATVVLIQFTPRLHISPYRAARLGGSLLYGLAGIVAIIAVTGLLRHTQADSSALGMAIMAGALIVMPLLAQKKRETAAQTGNTALRADAVQSATCAYLAGLIRARQGGRTSASSRTRQGCPVGLLPRNRPDRHFRGRQETVRHTVVCICLEGS